MSGCTHVWSNSGFSGPWRRKKTSNLPPEFRRDPVALSPGRHLRTEIDMHRTVRMVLMLSRTYAVRGYGPGILGLGHGRSGVGHGRHGPPWLRATAIGLCEPTRRWRPLPGVRGSSDDG